MAGSSPGVMDETIYPLMVGIKYFSLIYPDSPSMMIFLIFPWKMNIFKEIIKLSLERVLIREYRVESH
jgi:hypothetical protein